MIFVFCEICSSCFTLTMSTFVVGACPHAFQLMERLNITEWHMNVHAVEELYEAINVKHHTEVMRANLRHSSMENAIGNIAKGNSSISTATAQTEENITQNCHMGVPNADCGKGLVEQTSYPDNMPLDERFNQGITGDNSAPDATKSCIMTVCSTGDNSAPDALMSGRMRGSWCQDIIAEWYRTVDLGYRANRVKNTQIMSTYSKTPIAVVDAYLDVFLMRLVKTELVIELIKRGKLKLRKPEAKDFILNNTYITACLKEKECLQILLKSCKKKKVNNYCASVCLANSYSYTGYFYLRPSLLNFVRHIKEKELFNLILKIFLRVLPTRKQRSKQYECLKLLCLCIENEEFTSVQEVMHHLLKFKNNREKKQVTYEAVKQLVQSSRPDILHSLMIFHSFPLENVVVLYCVLSGKLHSI